MTELDAVNDMLMSIGQAPVTSLVVPGIKDVAIAKMRLERALRSALTRGWWFNTDEDFELTPDVDGHILIPEDALKIDSADADVTERAHPTNGRCLFDRSEGVFEFDEPITCRIVRGFDFVSVPQSLRDYVTVVAGRRFQSKAIGSQILDRFEEEDEQKAWLSLIREERASRRTNFFTSNRTASSFGRRTH